jgi:hypothetical protein
MNERIELPAQEWLGFDPEKGDIHGYTFEQMKEFAELIVRECLKQVRDEVQYLADWGKADQVVSAVKKHFGVSDAT